MLLACGVTSRAEYCVSFAILRTSGSLSERRRRLSSTSPFEAKAEASSRSSFVRLSCLALSAALLRASASSSRASFVIPAPFVERAKSERIISLSTGETISPSLRRAIVSSLYWLYALSSC